MNNEWWMQAGGCLFNNLDKPEKNDPQISQINTDFSFLICEICGQFLVYGTKISLIRDLIGCTHPEIEDTLNPRFTCILKG